MMSNISERAEYFYGFAERVIGAANRFLKTTAGLQGQNVTDAAGTNPLGQDIAADEIAAIHRVLSGNACDLPPYREAQLRELAFWRWVAFEGYNGNDSRTFPLHQEQLMVSTFYRTGWSLADFIEQKILELGCGPLGMIEYIPASLRVAFDPLNVQYSQLFSKCRSSDIKYLSEHADWASLEADFDFAICHNMIDHTEDPAYWFNTFFQKLRFSGRFLFQVNLSRSDVAQSDDHRRMHPAPFAEAQIMEWLQAKSDDFDFHISDQPSVDGEFYFLAWGRKTKEQPVRYEKLVSWHEA